MKTLIFIFLFIFSANAYSLRIDGDFNGWEGETIVTLDDGTFWIQSEYYYKYCYKYNPKVELYRESGKIKMLVEGCGDKGVAVEQINGAKTSIKGEFNGWNNETIVKLNDGTYWMQAERERERCRERNPDIMLYKKGYSYYMIVKGCNKKGIQVKQISDVIEAEIVNDFDGFSSGNFYELNNGQVWKQTDMTMEIYVRVRPEVLIYKVGSRYKMKLVDDDEICEVELSNNNSTNKNRSSNNSVNSNSTFLNVQNNTDKLLYFSYAAYNGTNGWQSNGWFKTEPFSNNTISIGFYTGKIYLYAEYNAGETAWFDSNSKFSFCIDKSNAFNIPNADTRDCSNSDYKRVKMSEFSVTPGVFNWTLNP
jgi:uncharacterized membrane protein